MPNFYFFCWPSSTSDPKSKVARTKTKPTGDAVQAWFHIALALRQRRTKRNEDTTRDTAHDGDASQRTHRHSRARTLTLERKTKRNKTTKESVTTRHKRGEKITSKRKETRNRQPTAWMGDGKKTKRALLLSALLEPQPLRLLRFWGKEITLTATTSGIRGLGPLPRATATRLAPVDSFHPRSASHRSSKPAPTSPAAAAIRNPRRPRFHP